MSKFLMVTHGTAGDILPFIRLAKGLRERGHEPVLMTHQPYEDYARRVGAEFVPTDSAAGFAKHMIQTFDLLRARTAPDMRRFYEQSGAFDQLWVECDILAARYSPGDTVLVGRYGTALSVLIAAEFLGAPAAWLALYPSQLITSPVQEYILKRALGAELDRGRAEYGLGPVTDFSAWLRSARLTLGLWPEWLDAAGPPAPPHIRVTGHVGGDELGVDDFWGQMPEPIASLMNGPVPPVLVTGGTGRALHEEFYRVAVGAAAQLERPTLVVTPYRDLLPRSLPPTMTWMPRAPFAQLLPHFAAMLHHGGIGTVMRALRAGVPQVIMAHGFDRPDNSVRLAGLGLAQWTPPQDWAVPTVYAQLQHAVTDAGYRARAMAVMADDDTGKAVTTAAEALETMLASAVGEVVT
jgi:rhamnosyltransferase subunit B